MFAPGSDKVRPSVGGPTAAISCSSYEGSLLLQLLPFCSLVSSSPMALRFMPSRRVGFALIAGCLFFSALVAADTRPGDLSVGEIEEQLQVIIHP